MTGFQAIYERPNAKSIWQAIGAEAGRRLGPGRHFVKEPLDDD
jgi:hypothetical protein